MGASHLVFRNHFGIFALRIREQPFDVEVLVEVNCEAGDVGLSLGVEVIVPANP